MVHDAYTCSKQQNEAEGGRSLTSSLENTSEISHLSEVHHTSCWTQFSHVVRMATSRFLMHERTPYKTFKSLITKENWNMFFEVQLKCSSEVPIVSAHLSHLFKKYKLSPSLDRKIYSFIYCFQLKEFLQIIFWQYITYTTVYWLPQ